MLLKDSNIINIPNPQGDTMGASLKSLLEVLEQWEKSKSLSEIIVNFKNVSFVHPFYILPICAVQTKEIKIGKRIEYELNNNIENYLNIINFPNGLDPKETNNWKANLLNYSSKTYLPICRVPINKNDTNIRDELLTTFENIMICQLNFNGQIITAIKYIISEAIDNIVEHSESDCGWLMAQYYQQKGYLDICIADTGIGILGSYKNIENNNILHDSDALKSAINGKSTKQISETRGYGIDTSRRMLVEGLKGKYLLFSGKAFYINTNDIEQITPLKDYGWNGTMIALQIPDKTPDGFNYINFLE